VYVARPPTWRGLKRILNERRASLSLYMSSLCAQSGPASAERNRTSTRPKRETYSENCKSIKDSRKKSEEKLGRVDANEI